MSLSNRLLVVVLVSVTGLLGFVDPSLDHPLIAQQPPPPPRSPFFGPAPAPAPLERLGPNLLRISNIVVDTAKRELSVSGFVNAVGTLEFLANTKDGFKAYESALELDTNATNFNVACILIGLDRANAVAPTQQFDPSSPKGDPVEIFVEWDEGATRRRIRAEELIYNRMSKQTLTEGPWVYTGSSFLRSGEYLAETDGTLIGFMHTPSPIVESPRPLVGVYGDSIINPALNLKAGTRVQLTLRAIGKPRERQ